jgi:pyruvate dehydrogenase E1 component alpha subunit
MQTVESPERDVLRALLVTMARIQACDELLRTNLARGTIGISYFSPGGHEAIAAGVAQAVEDTDYLVATYRGLHHEIAKGVPVEGLLAEMLGRSSGLAAGRGGAMHVCDPDRGVLITSGIVGSGLPMANGHAWASQVKGDGRVTVCTFGDGATNTGAFHEAMNLAAAWDLPIVFVCENNQYAETTPTAETYRCRSLADRGAAYGMAAEQVDGFDPVAVYERVQAAVNRARSGEGPTMIECTCFRFYGHYFGDPMVTVPAEDLDAARAKDPVARFAQRLIETHGFAGDEIDGLRTSATTEIGAAFEVALGAAPAELDLSLPGSYASPVGMGG